MQISFINLYQLPEIPDFAEVSTVAQLWSRQRFTAESRYTRLCFWARMCSLCALSALACPALLPKPAGRKTFRVKAEKSLKSGSVDVVWSAGPTGVSHGSFLRCANRVQFYLDALTINLTISLLTSHSLLFSLCKSLISPRCLSGCVTRSQ